MSAYHIITQLMDEFDGFCFVDFASSFAYVSVDMHPANRDGSQSLDAIFFSPHKLLGGPGTTGIVIFSRSLYHLSVPSNVGGGIVLWTNPWGQHCFYSHSEVGAREDAGTPAYLQLIRNALAVTLKERMDPHVKAIREAEMNRIAFSELAPDTNSLKDDNVDSKSFSSFQKRAKDGEIFIMGGHVRERLSIFSFVLAGLHHSLMVTLLNDRFGI